MTVHVRKQRLRPWRIDCDKAEGVVPNILVSVALRFSTGQEEPMCRSGNNTAPLSCQCISKPIAVRSGLG